MITLTPLSSRAVEVLVDGEITPEDVARIFGELDGFLKTTDKIDIYAEIRNAEFGIDAIIHDPLANPAEVPHEYGFELSSLDAFKDLDAAVFAVSHKEYKQMGAKKLLGAVRDFGDINWRSVGVVMGGRVFGADAAARSWPAVCAVPICIWWMANCPIRGCPSSPAMRSSVGSLPSVRG